MPPNGTCPNQDCPNRGILTLDANSIFYLVEGAIGYVQTLYPDLTNSGRLPHILSQLDSLLGSIRGCCSLDGSLYISDQVFNEVSLDDRQEINRKGLIELRKYNNAQRRQMLQVLQSHFPQPRVVPDQEIQALRGLFHNPEVRPHDRDASLIAVACHLAANGEPVVVLTSDPDFTIPLSWLIRQGSVILGEGDSLPTSRIIHRHYFNFVRRWHDCCNLPSEAYEILGNTYFSAQLQRLPNLRTGVMRRIVGELRELQAIHTKAVQYKCALA